MQRKAVLLRAPYAASTPTAPETDVPPLLGATCVHAASLALYTSGRGISMIIALCDPAFPSIQA